MAWVAVHKNGKEGVFRHKPTRGEDPSFWYDEVEVYDSERTKFPMKVVNIDEKMVYLDFEGNEGDSFECRMEDICPIPLTEEMLLKNEFIKSVYIEDKCFSFDIPTDDEFSLLKIVDEGFFVYMLGRLHEVKYVHQLQNILTIAEIEFEFKF